MAEAINLSQERVMRHILLTLAVGVIICSSGVWGQTNLTAPFTETPPTIDGVIGAMEWQDASSYDLPFLRYETGEIVSVPVYSVNDGVFLYIAAEVPFPSHTNAYFEAHIDGDHSHTINGVITEPHIDIGYTKAGTDSPSHGFNNSYKASPGMFVDPPIGSESAFSGTSRVQYEFKIVLSDLGPITGETVGLLLDFSTNYSSSGTYFYPTLDNTNCAAWANLYIAPGSQEGGDILVYATSETTYGYYASSYDEQLPAILAEDGFTVTVTDRMETPQITAALLDVYDQLWIMSTDPYSGSGCFSSLEINAIMDFRNAGKGILIMADDGPPGHSYIGDANQISTQLGVTFTGQYNYGPYAQPFEPDFSAHSLFSGVQTIVCTENASVLNVMSPVEIIASYAGNNMIAVLNDGLGRAVFDVSFVRFWDADERVGFMPHITVGNTPQYAKNIASWLDGNQQPIGYQLAISNEPLRIERNYELIYPPYEVGYFYMVKIPIINIGDTPFTSGSDSYCLIYEEDDCDIGDLSNPLCFLPTTPPHSIYLGYIQHKTIEFETEPFVLMPSETKYISIRYRFMEQLADYLKVTLHMKDDKGNILDPFGKKYPISTTVSSDAAINCLTTVVSTYTSGMDKMSGAGQILNNVLETRQWRECYIESVEFVLSADGFWDALNAINIKDWKTVGGAITEGLVMAGDMTIAAYKCGGGADKAIDKTIGLIPVFSALGDEILPHVVEIEGPGGCGRTFVEAVKSTRRAILDIEKTVSAFCAENEDLCYTADLLSKFSNPIRFIIDCPVDICVYSETGDSILIEDTAVQVNSIEGSMATQFQEIKLLDMPSAQSYSAIIKGTGYGNMTIESFFIDTDYSVHRIVYVDVQVSPYFIGIIENMIDTANGQRIFVSDTINQSDTTIIYPTYVENFRPGMTMASLAGMVIDEVSGMVGVNVDLFDSNGMCIGSKLTDQYGYFVFDDLQPGSYTVSAVSPLGYCGSPELIGIQLRAGNIYKVFMVQDKVAILKQARSRGYWMHQVNALLSGKGNAHETYEDMCGFMELIRTHINQHGLNPVNVFEVDLTDDCDQRLEALRATISPKPKATMNEKARAHMTAMLLNMVSGKIAQWHLISEDSLNVSQAITYCNSLITDGNPENDETAKNIAEMINEGQMVPAGMIDPTTANIAYKQSNENQLPTEFTLSQNYPNPFNPTTEISFALPKAANVKLDVFNITGQRITTLVNQHLEAGSHSAVWDGSQAASGIYFYRMQAEEFVETKKMVLLK